MTPEEIAASLGLTVAQIAGARGVAQELRTLGRQATSFIGLINLARRTTDLLKTYSPSLLYRLTQFWTTPGFYLKELPESQVIPLGFIGKLDRRPTGTLGEDEFRYDVYVTLHFPGGGRQSFGFSVDVPGPISEREAIARAWEMMLQRINPAHYDFGTGSEEDYFSPDFEVRNVHQLVA